ncbi:MAG TPA: iron chaperone [Clostridiaceae bacterium]|nr:iron chaperone [Clostridiaceae bacterium]
MANHAIIEFFDSIDTAEKQEKMRQVFDWIEKNYPQFDLRVGWNTPMFTDHGTYIVGFSTTKNHFSAGFESKIMEQFQDELRKREISHGKMIVRFPWSEEVDYDLLARMIDYTIDVKKDVQSFWLPREDTKQ